MRRPSILPSVAVLSATALALAAGDQDPVVVRAGAATIGRAAFEQRLAALPEFQLRALGDTAEQIKRRFAQSVLVPELLFGAEGERLKLGERPSVRDQTREVLRQALERDLRKHMRAEHPVTDADVQRYYDENKARFETPRRLRIWRILVDDEALAKSILQAAHQSDGVQRWSELAREHSLDQATKLRDGDLGFVRPDGSTELPALRVDPELFRAADGLADGELAQAPVREGEHLAVLWRRGSIPAVKRSLEQERDTIRQVLERKRLEDDRSELLAKLRERYVSGLDEAPLDQVDFGFNDRAGRPPPLRQPHPAAGAQTEGNE